MYIDTRFAAGGRGGVLWRAPPTNRAPPPGKEASFTMAACTGGCTELLPCMQTD